MEILIDDIKLSKLFTSMNKISYTIVKDNIEFSNSNNSISSISSNIINSINSNIEEQDSSTFTFTNHDNSNNSILLSDNYNKSNNKSKTSNNNFNNNSNTNSNTINSSYSSLIDNNLLQFVKSLSYFHLKYFHKRLSNYIINSIDKFKDYNLNNIDIFNNILLNKINFVIILYFLYKSSIESINRHFYFGKIRYITFEKYFDKSNTTFKEYCKNFISNKFDSRFVYLEFSSIVMTDQDYQKINKNNNISISTNDNNKIQLEKLIFTIDVFKMFYNNNIDHNNLSSTFLTKYIGIFSHFDFYLDPYIIKQINNFRDKYYDNIVNNCTTNDNNNCTTTDNIKKFNESKSNIHTRITIYNKLKSFGIDKSIFIDWDIVKQIILLELLKFSILSLNRQKEILINESKILNFNKSNIKYNYLFNSSYNSRLSRFVLYSNVYQFFSDKQFISNNIENINKFNIDKFNKYGFTIDYLLEYKLLYIQELVITLKLEKLLSGYNI